MACQQRVSSRSSMENGLLRPEQPTREVEAIIQLRCCAVPFSPGSASWRRPRLFCILTSLWPALRTTRRLRLRRGLSLSTRSGLCRLPLPPSPPPRRRLPCLCVQPTLATCIRFPSHLQAILDLLSRFNQIVLAPSFLRLARLASLRLRSRPVPRCLSTLPSPSDRSSFSASPPPRPHPTPSCVPSSCCRLPAHSVSTTSTSALSPRHPPDQDPLSNATTPPSSAAVQTTLSFASNLVQIVVFKATISKHVLERSLLALPTYHLPCSSL